MPQKSVTTRPSAASRADRTTKRARKVPANKLVRKRSIERTTRAILQSALELFSTNSFEGTSIRAIAAKAGVNHAMILHIYGGKEQLWHEAMSFLFARAAAELSIDTSRMTLREAAEAQIRTFVRYCAKYPEHGRMMIQLSVAAGPQLSWTTRKFVKPRHEFRLLGIELLKGVGILPDIETFSILQILAAACQMIFVLAPEIKSLTGRDVTAPEEVEKHADAVIAMFMR